MISKETIKKYVLNNPSDKEFIYGFTCFVGVFAIMLIAVNLLEGSLLLIGFIIGGILIGLSLTFTKNIFFPIAIILSYNFSIVFINDPIHIELVFTTVTKGIGDALFLSFVVYWIVAISQYIISWFKKIKTSEEPITTKKFILGSVIAGFIYGILMIIQSV